VSFARLSGADLAFDEAGYVVFRWQPPAQLPRRDRGDQRGLSRQALVLSSRSGGDPAGLRPDRQSPVAATTFCWLKLAREAFFAVQSA
jgi:hypothetical protein